MTSSCYILHRNGYLTYAKYIKYNISCERGYTFMQEQPRVSSEYWKQIPSSGLWQAGEGKNVYIADDALWYLYNTNPDEYYLKHCVGETGGIFDEMMDEYQARKDRIKQAEAASIKIVRFRLLG